MQPLKIVSRKIQFLILLLVSLQVITYGQNDCQAILNHGIYDYDNSSGETSLVTSFISWYKSRQYHSLSEATNSSMGIRIPIVPLLDGIFNDHSEKTFDEFNSAIDNYQNSSSEFKRKFQNNLKSINSSVVKAWEDCIYRNSVGLQWSFKMVSDNKFIVFCSLNKTPDISLSKIHFDIDSKNALSTNGGSFLNADLTPKSDVIITSLGTYSQTFSRIKNEDVIITINADESQANTAKLIIPKIPPPSPPPHKSLNINRISIVCTKNKGGTFYACINNLCDKKEWREFTGAEWDECRNATFSISAYLKEGQLQESKNTFTINTKLARWQNMNRQPQPPWPTVAEIIFKYVYRNDNGITQDLTPEYTIDVDLSVESWTKCCITSYFDLDKSVEENLQINLSQENPDLKN